MNRIKCIAAAAAISTAVIAPATAAVAYAEPTAPTQDQIEQLLRQEQQYTQERKWLPRADGKSASDATTGLPWDVGLAALGAGVLAAGGVVLVRRYQHEPRPA